MITDRQGLRDLYRQPSEVAGNKDCDRIDAASAAFIANCPMVMLATSSSDGTTDCSPRGGPAGFVKVLDEKHLAIPDLNGNNRLDSHENLVDNPHAGLLFLVPGRGETLRVNGRAVLSSDQRVIDLFTAELRRPKLAIVVRVDELYLHCAKAILRSKLWEPESWAGLDGAPDGAEIYATQFPDYTLEGMRERLDQSYVEDLAADLPS